MDWLVYFGLFPPQILAGALGGVLRWWAARDGWRFGLFSVVCGAIIGNYVGAAIFIFADQAAAFAGMEPQAARLLGAHLCGVIGINLYAIPADWFRARRFMDKSADGWTGQERRRGRQ